MDWLRITAADGFAARLPVGVWLASLLGSWGLAAGALAAGLRRGRRVAPALRRATAACIVELLGLAAMIFLDNPGRWSSRAWLISLSPLAAAVAAVALAAGRGDDLAGVADAGESA
jgi:peptidoglycan/LPS O-acetylase OafA/YrhL